MNVSPSRPPRIAQAWSEAWKSRRFRFVALVTAIFLPLTLRSLAAFLNTVEQRPGVILPDPLLSLFQPVDLTWITFGIIYLGLIAGIIVLLRDPLHLVVAVQTYILMVVFRIIAMALIPLDPPPDSIPLNDPLVQLFGTGHLLTKDLFFSGHTATLFLLGLSMPGRGLRMTWFAGALSVAICVLLQHDHYAIDVVAAPFFAYVSYRIITLFQRHTIGKPASRAEGGDQGTSS